MWRQIANHFDRYPSQAKVAKLLLEQGFRAHQEMIYAGDVELGDVAVGEAVGFDRQIVKSAVETIESTPELPCVFSKLKPTSFHIDVASEMDWSSIEIAAINAATPGIVADVTRVIAQTGISIRKTIVTDPDLSNEPRLNIITESPVPPVLIPVMKNCRGVN